MTNPQLPALYRPFASLLLPLLTNDFGTLGWKTWPQTTLHQLILLQVQTVLGLNHWAPFLLETGPQTETGLHVIIPGEKKVQVEDPSRNGQSGDDDK